jgi:hypothetical protein
MFQFGEKALASLRSLREEKDKVVLYILLDHSEYFELTPSILASSSSVMIPSSLKKEQLQKLLRNVNRKFLIEDKEKAKKQIKAKK